jgi:hypothetical protein
MPVFANSTAPNGFLPKRRTSWLLPLELLLGMMLRAMTSGMPLAQSNTSRMRQRVILK